MKAAILTYQDGTLEKKSYVRLPAYSSFSGRVVRIYGHFPVIHGNKTAFYRHPIHEFSFTALDGKDKWTAYNFTKNIYEVWVPSHLKRICSVVDQLLPDLNFEGS